jgi:hypothetical protein
MTAPSWAKDPTHNVFVNCPFDTEFNEQRDAIIFTCVQSGFVPWMAGSTGDIATPRMQRILSAFDKCRYSIHDLSRYQGEGELNLARFNMPLELGVAMGLRGLDPAEGAHDWLVLVREGHLYRRVVSDLAGFDPMTHDGSPAQAAVAVLSWLMTRPDVEDGIGPDEVLPKLVPFLDAKANLDKQWNGSPPWKHVLDLAVTVARR